MSFLDIILRGRSEDIDNSLYSVSGNSFGIDFGSCNVKIYNHTTGKIKSQKNMIAVQDRKNVIAWGDKAYEMYERTPSGIRVSRPVNDGVIADIGHMSDVIRSFLQDEQRGVLRPADFFIAIPTDATQVQRRAFYELIRDAGVRARKIMGAERAIAGAIGLGVDVRNTQGILLVDVGYETTEVTVMSMGGIVLSKLLKIGGRLFDTAIVNAVRREYRLDIGTKTAEALRISLSTDDGRRKDAPQTSGLTGAGIGSADVYGRDIVTGLPAARTITKDFIGRTLNEHFSMIAENVRTILERTPPELSADIFRHGLFLTGGGSMEEELIDQIQREVRIDVNLAEDPVATVAIGLAQIMRRSHYRQLAYTIEGLTK